MAMQGLIFQLRLGAELGQIWKLLVLNQHLRFVHLKLRDVLTITPLLGQALLGTSVHSEWLKGAPDF